MSARTLIIYMSFALNWDRMFQEVRIKMEESIGKLSNTLMNIQLTYFHVNSYFMSKIYFGCGTMEMTYDQDKELRKTYETPLARKLVLGSSFQRKMMCRRVISMGLEIVAPKTAIVDLVLKLCLSHRRK